MCCSCSTCACCTVFFASLILATVIINYNWGEYLQQYFRELIDNLEEKMDSS